MKKLYALLLLGSLLLLGTTSAWADADKYYIKHNWNGGAWEWKEMTDNGDGTYSYVGYFSNNDGCNWNTSGSDEGANWIAKEDLNIQNTVGGKTFDLTHFAFKFTLDPTGASITLTPAFYNVTLYVNSTVATKVYAWYTYDIMTYEPLGGWSGTAFAGNETISGKSWKKIQFTFPKDKRLKFIANNGNSGNNNQTDNVEVCDIVDDNMAFFYTITSKDADHNWDFVRNYSLVGDFNTWNGQHDIFVDGEVTLTLDANTTYDFKVFNGKDWYGVPSGDNDDMYWYDCSEWTLTTAAGNQNCVLHTNFAGSYKFSYDASTNELNVTYPKQTFTASFDKTKHSSSTGWEDVYAHLYRNENSADRVLNTFPGTQATDANSDGIYEFSIVAPAVPTKIIWSKGEGGEGNQSYTHDFVEGAIYTYESITKYPLVVSSIGWASLYLPFDAEVPAGATAYYARVINNDDEVTFTQIPLTGEKRVIPANCGVLINAAAATYDFVPFATTPTAVTSLLGGVLVASTTVSEISVESGYKLYVFGVDNTSQPGFYPVASSFELSAYKAYLIAPIQTSAPGMRFVIEEENNATNINAIDATEEVVKFFQNGKLFIQKNGVVYDMMGTIVK